MLNKPPPITGKEETNVQTIEVDKNEMKSFQDIAK
jgi:hypothetical protein